MIALGCLAVTAAHAQDVAKPWPNKPLRIVVGFPAGSVTDTVARVVAEQLTKTLGQPVVVENKPGANGAIGVGEVARAAPDGYTLLVTNSSSITINPQLYKQITYKASDFVPITMIIEAPFILAVNPEWAQKNSVDSIQALIRYAQAQPDKLTYGSGGQGNLAHLSFVSLSNRANIKTTHVPYKSGALAGLAIISGELNAGFDTLSTVPNVQAGKLKALAVTSSKRIAQLPDLPTMAEAGFAGFEITFWMGLLAPAGTAQPIITKIYEAARLITTNPKAEAILKSNGEPVMLDPKSFANLISKEVPVWGEVIRREALVLD
ncbi:MAG: tripartite tricarboxylate transporter substrate binding protein [Alcaligenaceae bacterium]|nr:tripartite tricarboxylate transporter substrate binding protein [Alcaligenaceae bacterium]